MRTETFFVLNKTLKVVIIIDLKVRKGAVTIWGWRKREVGLDLLRWDDETLGNKLCSELGKGEHRAGCSSNWVFGWRGGNNRSNYMYLMTNQYMLSAHWGNQECWSWSTEHGSRLKGQQSVTDALGRVLWLGRVDVLGERGQEPLERWWEPRWTMTKGKKWDCGFTMVGPG